MSKKIVVKLDLHDNKDKQRALKAVSVLVGIDAISIDMATRKMTVIGTVDPVNVVSKLRKASWAAHIESVGPAKEPEKKEDKKEDKKDEAKKEGDGAAKEEESGDGKKEGGGDGKKDDTKEGEEKKEGSGDGKKKEEGGGDKKDEAKKDGGDQKKPAVAPPFLPMPHQLPPPYMFSNPEYMMNHYRPPPPAYQPYVPPQQPHYYVRNMSMEENPNSCTIS